jgi:hypothetical protein
MLLREPDQPPVPAFVAGFYLLVASRTNHPTSETGRAVFNVPLEGLDRRRLVTPQDSKSDRILQQFPNY